MIRLPNIRGLLKWSRRSPKKPETVAITASPLPPPPPAKPRPHKPPILPTALILLGLYMFISYGLLYLKNKSTASPPEGVSNYVVPALGLGALALAVLGVLLALLWIRIKEGRGINPMGTWWKAVGTFLAGFHKFPGRFMIYLPLVWFIVVGISWLYQETEPTLWKLFASNELYTWTVSFLMLVGAFFSREEYKLVKSFGVVVGLFLLYFGLVSIYKFLPEDFKNRSWITWNTASSDYPRTTQQNASSSSPVLITQFTITSNEWRTYDLPTGRSRVKVLGPTEAQTFYQNEYRETLRFEGGNYVTGNGPTDMLRLRALQPGEEVLVEIYKIQ